MLLCQAQRGEWLSSFMGEKMLENLICQYVELHLPRPAPPKSASKTGLVIQPTVPDEEQCLRALAKHGLLMAMHDGGSSSAHINRVLHAAGICDGDPGCLLCLRCRVSEHIRAAAKKIYSDHKEYIDNYGDQGYEVLASLVLTDDGKLESWSEFSKLSHDSQKSTTTQPLAFSILQSFDPDRAALSTWTWRSLKGYPELKRYLRECGVALISEWALLANRCTVRRIMEAYVHTSHTGVSSNETVALWCSFLEAYRAEFAHRIKPSNWQPDVAFWNRVHPTYEWWKLEGLFKALAQGVRILTEKQHLSISLDSRLESKSSSEAYQRPAFNEAYLVGEHDSDVLLRHQQDCALSVAQAALERALDHYMPAVILGSGRDPELCRCLWQGYADGLSQRRIAERCGCSQKTVSVTLREQMHLEEIATRWALEIKSSASWAEQVRQDPDLEEAFMRVRDVEALSRRLRNQLAQPEQGTNEPPLRRWLKQYLHNH